MNIATYTIRSNNLLKEISIHPHKDELLELMYQQVQDELDTPTIITSTAKTQKHNANSFTRQLLSWY